MIEDKRLCPHCLGELHRQPYLMSVRDEPVMSVTAGLWLLCGLLAACLLLAIVTG